MGCMYIRYIYARYVYVYIHIHVHVHTYMLAYEAGVRKLHTHEWCELRSVRIGTMCTCTVYVCVTEIRVLCLLRSDKRRKRWGADR